MGDSLGSWASLLLDLVHYGCKVRISVVKRPPLLYVLGWLAIGIPPGE